MGKDDKTMAMSAKKVESIVSRIIYKPGFTFSADTSYGECRVRIKWDQIETNPENAPGYTERGVPMEHHLHIDCDQYANDVEVLRTILEHCIKFELDQLVHEAREFFRIKPEMSWAAPFHPHHAVGADPDNYAQGYNGADNWRSTSFRQLPATAGLPEAQI